MNAIVLSPIDRDAAIRTVLGEARNQGIDGMMAVAWTIRHRAFWDEELTPGDPEHEWWGTSVFQACRHPYQFSCWNGGADTDFINTVATDNPQYVEAGMIVDSVFDSPIDHLTGGSTSYKVRGTRASWDAAVASFAPREIGAHDFWRLTPDGHVQPFIDA